jgi:hypothetical protein
MEQNALMLRCSPYLATELRPSCSIGERLETLELIHAQLDSIIKMAVEHSPKDKIMRTALIR